MRSEITFQKLYPIYLSFSLSHQDNNVWNAIKILNDFPALCLV